MSRPFQWGELGKVGHDVPGTGILVVREGTELGSVSGSIRFRNGVQSGYPAQRVQMEWRGVRMPDSSPFGLCD